MKQLIACTLLCASFAAIADASTNMLTLIKQDGTVMKVPADAFREKQLRRTGGRLKVPNVQKGQVVIVDAKSGASRDALGKVAAQFAKEYCIDVAVKDGAFSFPKPEIVGDVSVFVVDDPNLPMSLAALEARWAVVNIAPLKHEKKQFFDARVRKETVRALAMLCGGCNSSYPDALTSAVTKPEDLDQFPDTRLQAEYHDRFIPYLKGLGVVPYRMTTYRAACEQGWAPAPTNEIQKTVWDKAHEIPSKPIKIEYNEKRDKGK